MGIGKQISNIEWKVNMQKIITGFQQVNAHLSQMEDLMKEELPETKQQLNETVLSPELLVLTATPDKIDGKKNNPVCYSDTIVRNGYVKNSIRVWDLRFSSKESIEKIWEVTEMDIFVDLLEDCLRQKELEQWDVFYKWSRCTDSVGVT